MEEALVAIHAAETEAQQHHQELLHLKTVNIRRRWILLWAVVAEQYKVQLTSAQGSLQSWDLEHKLEVQKLQEKIHALEVSLASQGASNLPSVGVSQQVHRVVLPFGRRFSISSRGWSISARVLHSIIARTKPSPFRSR